MDSKSSNLKKWFGLLVISMALAIVIIDTTVLNVSLKNIIADLHTDLRTMQWIITIYSLILAAFTITGGRLGDLFGRKKMFLLGALLFGLGSFIASISTSAGMLLFGWSVVEGIGAALMMPATASMLIATFQDKERAIAFGVWGGIAGAASAFGPLLGGYLTTNASWHWAFRINVVIVLIVLIAGSLILKESIDKKESHTLDLGGSLFSALAMASIIYGIIESSTYGWWVAKKAWEVGSFTFNFWGLSVTPFAIGLGIIFLILFVLWEQRMKRLEKTPLVTLSIFNNKQFVVGILVTSIMALGQSGIIFALPVFFQSVRGLDAFTTGQSLLPMSLSVLIVAPLSGLLRKKVPTRDLIQLGLAFSTVGTYVIYKTLSVTANPSDFTLGLALMGIGMGLTMSQISNVTLSAIDPNLAGEASGINNTTRQLGSSLGSALIGAVFIATITTSMVAGINDSKMIPDSVKPAIVQQVQDGNNTFGNSNMGGNSPAAIAIGKEIGSIANTATVDGSKAGLVYTIGFSVLTLAVSMVLPRDMSEKKSKNEPVVAVH